VGGVFGKGGLRFLRFCMVGSIGFAVDGGGLVALVSSGVSPYAARLVSFPLAVTVTWLLNRTWAFAGSATPRPGREYVLYFLVQIAGALVNLGVYVMLLTQWEVRGAHVIIPFAVGSAAGLIANYLGLFFLVFTGRGREDKGAVGQPPSAAPLSSWRKRSAETVTGSTGTQPSASQTQP
jgi:putative flippase GtrA